MKAKKFIFGLMACVTLLAFSCEPTNTAEEDEMYEVGIDKGSIVLKNQVSIDKSSIVLKKKRGSIDKSSIVLKD